MNIIKLPNMDDVANLLKRPAQSVESLRDTVMVVIDAVRTEGDVALRRYTQKFDGACIAAIRVDKAEIDEANNLIDSKLKKSIALAANNIEAFHRPQLQREEKINPMSGITCWRKSIGIERVGLYIPGGSAPLFSTVLMLGIPARIAGCVQVALCTPPDKSGRIHPAILYAASVVGITEIYKVGGIQAVAAMAFGTESIARVDKIFGPGNAYVTAAKQLVSNMGVAIDMPAGPSEVMVLADRTCTPAFVAADLLSQAEHGPDSQVVLVSDDESVIEKTLQEVGVQLETLERKTVAQQSLAHSRAVLVRNADEMIRVANVYAPEHLIIATDSAEQLAEKVSNAGSVFIGHYSPESAGDYASGTNHSLPTGGWARSFSGVSVDSFVRKITFQHLTREGMASIGDAVVVMAESEGLHAHANAVKVRLK